MKQKRTAWKWIALSLMIAMATGITGFLIGRNATASNYQAELDLN